MNGEPLPLKHGYPLRAIALGWTGANCVKWLYKITLLDRPFEGFFMDKVYRVFQKGEDPASGEVVTQIKLKSIITQPAHSEKLPAGTIVVLGAALPVKQAFGMWKYRQTMGNPGSLRSLSGRMNRTRGDSGSIYGRQKTKVNIH